MKLSELIKSAQEVYAQHGDITATCYWLNHHIRSIEKAGVKFRNKSKSMIGRSCRYWNESDFTEKEKGEMVFAIE
jgi:competence transcription factor ComK